MDLLLLRRFQSQVVSQCHVVLMNAAIAQDELDAAFPRGQEPFWAAMLGVLTGSANLSKALWGQSGSKTAQRRPLRESLGVPDNAPYKLTRMRNHFEHYDERLDEWWARSSSHNSLDQMIGPPSAVVGLADTDRFRVFDPATGELVFWGESLHIPAVVKSVAELRPRAEAQAAKPHW
jgi:hypothetical protein